MAAENRVICLIDSLWFHQIILFPEPSSSHFTDLDPKKPAESPSENTEIVSSVASAITDPQDEIESDDDKERRSRFPSKTRSRSHSSSPISAPKRSRNHLGIIRLQKTMSCKSLKDLELEEVKGFMDLGFVFRKENLSKRIVSLIPGLQRIDDSCKNDDEDEDDEDEQGVMRPYLSEAWIIRRPDSPLLNLRIPRVCTTADMKKHLRYWAQTVASAIHQES